MEYNFVLYPVNNPYAEAVFHDLRGEKNVFFCKTPKSAFLRRLHAIHTSIKTNKVLKLPFQNIWYRYYYMNKDNNFPHVFAFVQGNALGYNIDYLNYLKKKYKNSKFCFYWVNLASTVSPKYVEFVQKEYDSIYTDEPNDCEKYGWSFIESTYSDVTKWNLPEVEESDVFFIGGAKDRLQLLHDIYDLFTEQGYKCDFHIVNVNKENQKRKGIVYNQRMDYKEVLAHCKRTKIILEIVQDGQDGATLRTCESIIFKKKLLTNNKGLKKSELYTNHVCVFEDINDINPSKLFESNVDNDLLNEKKLFLNPTRFVNILGKVFGNE